MTEPAPPADTAGDLHDAAVRDADGWKAGVVRRVLPDGSGRPEFAVVHLGGLLGHDVLVPLGHAVVKEDGVHLGARRDRVLTAPSAPDGTPTEQQRDAAYAHFGMHSLASDDDPDRQGRSRDDGDDRPHGDTALIRVVQRPVEDADG